MITKILETTLPKAIHRRLKNVNRGGCLVFAQALHYELVQRKIKCSVHIVDPTPTQRFTFEDFDFLEHITNTKGINSALQFIAPRVPYNPVLQMVYEFPHCAVKVNGVLYDDNGVFTGKVLTHRLTDKTMIALVQQPIWNETFEDSNPRVNHPKTELRDIIHKVIDSL